MGTTPGSQYILCRPVHRRYDTDHLRPGDGVGWLPTHRGVQVLANLAMTTPKLGLGSLGTHLLSEALFTVLGRLDADQV